jgi:hypothetical protein
MYYRLYGKLLSFGKKILSVPGMVQTLRDVVLSLTQVAVTWRETILMHLTTYSAEQVKKLQIRNCKKNKRIMNGEWGGYRRCLSTSN